MIDIAELQKLEVAVTSNAPKNGVPACCVATGTHYSSFLPTFKEVNYRSR